MISLKMTIKICIRVLKLILRFLFISHMMGLSGNRKNHATMDNVTMKSDDFSMLFEAEIPEEHPVKNARENARQSIYTLCLKLALEYDSQ